MQRAEKEAEKEPRVGQRPLLLATGVAAALPLLVSTIRAVVEGWAPLGDDALIAVRSFEVLSEDSPLVGMPSTGPTGVLAEQTFHLGPLLFWVLALPAHFLGPSSLAVTVGLVNIASVMGVIGLAHRRGGRPLMFAAAFAVPVMLVSIPAESYSDVWNPAAPVLPFTLLIFVTWSLACGEYRLLPLAVVAASFAAQCHLIYLLPVLGVMTVGLAGLATHLLRNRGSSEVENSRTARRWVLAAVVVGVICWSAPLIDQAVNRPGNLVQLARAAQADAPNLGPGKGTRAVVRAVGVPPWWLRDPRGPLERVADLDNPPGALAVGSAVLVLGGLALVVWSGWRARRGSVVAAGALALVLCAAIGLATASVPSASFASTSYGLWWASPVGMWAWLALGWSIATLVGPRLAIAPRSGPATAAGLAVAFLVGGAVAISSAPLDEPFRQLRIVTDRLETRLPSERAIRVEGTWQPEAVFTAAGFQLGIVYWLLRDGREVTAPSLPDLGSRYRRDTERGPVSRLRVDVDRPPVDRGRLIARFAVSTADPENPFSDAPVRTVAVTLTPAKPAR